MFVVRCLGFVVRCSLFGVCCSLFVVCCSLFVVWCLVFGVIHFDKLSKSDAGFDGTRMTQIRRIGADFCCIGLICDYLLDLRYLRAILNGTLMTQILGIGADLFFLDFFISRQIGTGCGYLFDLRFEHCKRTVLRLC